MRIVKWITAVLLLLTAVCYMGNGIYEKVSGKDQGPVITGPEEVLEVSVTAGEEELLAGITAWDQQDGDLTGQIIVGGVSKLVGGDTAKVTCLVFDSDDNMASLVRPIRYTDYCRPVIELTDALVYSGTETALLLERVRVTDSLDGDLSASARVSSLWPTDRDQVFSATILVTNSMGDTASVEVPVIIREENAARPQIHLTEQIVYVDQGSSFDPWDYTSRSGGLEIENNVDTSQPGCYWVWYYDNSTSVQGLAILTVVVQ